VACCARWGGDRDPYIRGEGSHVPELLALSVRYRTAPPADSCGRPTREAGTAEEAARVEHEQMRDAQEAEREVAEGVRAAQETLRLAAEEARGAAVQAREVLAELTELGRRMRLALEAQEAVINDLRQRRDSPPAA
jgi:hypothetical protein